MTGKVVDYGRILLDYGNHCSILADEGKIG